jgi:hypothetical protein
VFRGLITNAFSLPRWQLPKAAPVQAENRQSDAMGNECL